MNCIEAEIADEFEAMKAENDRLRAALTQISMRDNWTSGECRHHARTTLT